MSPCYMMLGLKETRSIKNSLVRQKTTGRDNSGRGNSIVPDCANNRVRQKVHFADSSSAQPDFPNGTFYAPDLSHDFTARGI